MLQLNSNTRKAYAVAGGVLPAYRVGQAVVAVKGSGMQAEPRHLGRVGVVTGVHLFRGDSQHHYTVEFNNGTDSIDERCLGTVQ